MIEDAKWIWKDTKYCTKHEQVLFRKKVFIKKVPKELWIDVSADSRYNLFINEKIVSRGPCRGDLYTRYYESADIAGYLKEGYNIVSAVVIHYLYDVLDINLMKSGPVSVVSSTRGGFLLRERDSDFGLSTDASYKCFDCTAYSFVDATIAGYLGYFEQVDGRNYPCDWKSNDYCDDDWPYAKEIYDSKKYIYGGLATFWTLKKRVIPPAFEKGSSFQSITRSSEVKGALWKGLLEGSGILIPENTKAWVELDAGEYITGFPKLFVQDGRDSEIELLYAESYGVLDENNNFKKLIRDDFSNENAVLFGEKDKYICADGEQCYEPMYYRAFRFLRLNIETSANPLIIKHLQLTKTGYPLDITGSFHSDCSDMNTIWDMSVRSLCCCMYETYMDCPYFEQMQYIMDTFLQMIYTYQISKDDRLARKAISDFANAQLPNGLLPCNAPAKFTQIIPGFNFYWILMLLWHYQYYGDIDFIKGFFGNVELVLNYFLKHIDKKDGLLKETGYWQFVDWVKEWEMGVPTNDTKDINIIYNMMLVSALSAASQLNKAAGRDDTAKEYENHADNLKTAIKNIAFDNVDGLFLDSPGKTLKSQHAQAWAVFAGVVDGLEAKKLMEKCMKRTDLCKCSICMSFFLFRALEMTEMYELTQSLWETWRNQIDNHLTTWIEDPVSERSDCHAWGSLPLYEYAACVLGVKPLTPGYSSVLIKPKALWVKNCSGKVATVKGDIDVSVSYKEDHFTITVDTPVGMHTVVIMPNGSKHEYDSDGKRSFDCRLIKGTEYRIFLNSDMGISKIDTVKEM